MSLVPFDTLPDSARLWCFGADRDLAPEESEALREAISEFVEVWTAHDRRLSAGFEWTDDRFLVVGVDEALTEASGCSIDSLLRRLQSLEGQLSASLADGRLVWYRAPGGGVRSVTRADFRSLAAGGDVDAYTPVFDLSLTSVGELRTRGMERPASESWHSRYLAGQAGTG